MGLPPRSRTLTRDGATGAVTEAVTAALVDDLQGQSPDLGWPDASSMVDALVDALSHLLVDLGAGAGSPRPRPEVIGALGGAAGPLDPASCRATAGSLRRAGATLLAAEAEEAKQATAWAGRAGEVALDLADLLDSLVDQARSGRLRPSHKGPVVRRLRSLQRQLDAV